MSTPELEELINSINITGEKIKTLKAEKPPTLKEDLAPLVNQLLGLKLSYKTITGEEFGGPKPEKVKGPAQEARKSDGPSKTELNKMAKKAEKERLRAEAKAAAGIDVKAFNNAPAAGDSDDLNSHLYGDLPIIQSRYITEKAYKQIGDITDNKIGMSIWLRGRVSNSRGVAKGCFLIVRQGISTVQAVVFQGKEVSKSMIKYATGISLESVVDIHAEITRPETPIQSVSLKNIELQIKEIHVVSRAQNLPFLVEDAARNPKEAEANGLPIVGQDVALNFRWIDTRTPANQAIFRIQAGVCQLFREYFISKNFIEIHSPKLIGGSSEGGANIFKLKYFDQPACLAQSPQLYKQMSAACGGFDRVFEIGPVFRAEDSNTHR